GIPFITEWIDAAHGGNWTEVADERDPALNLGDFKGHEHKMRIYYSGDDEFVPAETQTGFASPVGFRAVPIGDVGHGEPVYDAFPDADLARFLWWRYRHT